MWLYTCPFSLSAYHIAAAAAFQVFPDNMQHNPLETACTDIASDGCRQHPQNQAKR